MQFSDFRIGLVSFSDPRETSFARQREEYIERKHNEVVTFLRQRGFAVVDPLAELRRGWKQDFGLRKPSEVERAIKALQDQEAAGVILGCWHWTEPMLPLSVVRALRKPALVYAEDDPTWAGAVCLSAVGASLWESAANPHCLTHHRLLGDLDGIVPWARGVAALHNLQRSSLVLWGGSYCLRMEHLQDDIPKLKSFLVGDILTEGEYFLIKRAEAILADQPQRIDRFHQWLREGGTQITYDEKMLTELSHRKQIALYLAARDRLSELAEEPIIGASLRCQHELSVEYGVTGCLIPAFLPFPEDSEGKREIIATVCEGDIKGLITCALFGRLRPDIPPLFGDLKYVGKDYLIISNCGGSSVYYAAGSNEPGEVLPRVRLAAQCQGESGGAVGYDGQPGPITIGRLVRIQGRYLMQLGLGQSLEITPEVTSKILWGQTWPHLAISLGVPQDLLVQVAGSNHYAGIPGDYRAEVEFACREAGIAVLRIDSETELRAAVREGVARLAA